MINTYKEKAAIAAKARQDYNKAKSREQNTIGGLIDFNSALANGSPPTRVLIQNERDRLNKLKLKLERAKRENTGLLLIAIMFVCTVLIATAHFEWVPGMEVLGVAGAVVLGASLAFGCGSSANRIAFWMAVATGISTFLVAVFVVFQFISPGILIELSTVIYIVNVLAATSFIITALIYKFVERPSATVSAALHELESLADDLNDGITAELGKLERWRKADESIDAYLSKVVSMNRPVLVGEYLAARNLIAGEQPERSDER